jgi:hypothetical protein
MLLWWLGRDSPPASLLLACVHSTNTNASCAARAGSQLNASVHLEGHCCFKAHVSGAAGMKV